MFTNNNFNEALKKSGLTMYAAAKYTGVPYTTINEIHNGKVDINQCAAATVWRLAGVLDVKPDEIMNPINYLDGVKGRHRCIDYVWSTGDYSQITFEYQGEKVTLSTGAKYNIPSRLRYYSTFANWMIDDYIEERQMKHELQALRKRVKSDV